jgi:hypothetical protein
MARTQIINNAPITLSPTFGQNGSGTALNPLYTACDAANGNYFMTTGRDLVSFYCAPAASAPVWLSTTTYLIGQVVNFASGSPAVTQSYIAIQGGLNQSPATSPAYWAPYADGQSTITLLSAPDACTSRTSDVDDYVVPVATETYPSTEFLVLPSSVFTQSNQQFQFTASSNLVSVYVRNF